MKPIKFRSRAEQDLLGIVTYYSEFSDEAVQNVLNDIYRSIRPFLEYFGDGLPISVNVRKIWHLNHIMCNLF